MKREFSSPFFTLNPKAYLYGQEALELAVYADKLAIEMDIDIFLTAQHADIFPIKQATSKVIVTAQHIDPITPGRGMGHILPESVKQAGAEATFLNHAEHPLTQAQLTKAIERCNSLGIITIVCADSLKDAEIIAHLEPDIMVCEQTELIGTGKTADIDYMRNSNEMVYRISPQTRVLQAAGISTPQDVHKAILSGAGGTGGTSGIVCADDPKQVLFDMLCELKKGVQ